MKTWPWFVAAAGLCVLLGLVIGKRLSPTQTVEKVVYQDRIVTQEKVVKQVVDRVVKRPDGTVETTKTVTDSDTQTSSKTKLLSVTKVQKLHRYSLDLSIGRSFSSSTNAYRALIGARIGDLPLWLQTGLEYQPRTQSVLDDSSVLVGLSWRW